MFLVTAVLSDLFQLFQTGLAHRGYFTFVKEANDEITYVKMPRAVPGVSRMSRTVLVAVLVL